ncbi:MAG TPA: FkbM family methyltransferase [Gaiellaceae bacterium]|nr:FkbM family methyltransferase [Gaiellaceae bacterium]
MIRRLVAGVARAYVVRFPLARGKGFVVGSVAPRLPVEDREFEAAVPGGTVVLRWDEASGRRVLREGAYELAEVEAARRVLAPGDTAIDVGANVGLFTIPLATAAGHVVAVEPLAENVERLVANVSRNSLDNVTVVDASAGDTDGTIELTVAADPAFGSVGEVTKHHAAGTRAVRSIRIDSLWAELGCPPVAFLKIDVEGAELRVLDGASELLRTCRPVLLVEADPGDAAAAVAAHLSGYTETTPAGFSPVNHLFEPL